MRTEPAEEGPPGRGGTTRSRSSRGRFVWRVTWRTVCEGSCCGAPVEQSSGDLTRRRCGGPLPSAALTPRLLTQLSSGRPHRTAPSVLPPRPAAPDHPRIQ